MTKKICIGLQDQQPEYETLEDLGEISLDKYKIERIKFLTEEIFDEKVKDKYQILTVQRIITLCYNANINYVDAKLLILELSEIHSDMVYDIYSNYSKNSETYTLRELIKRPKRKHIDLTSKDLERVENQIKITLLIANRSSYPTIEIGDREDIVLNVSQNYVSKCRYKDQDRTQPTVEEKILIACPVCVNVLIDPLDPYNRTFDWIFIEKNRPLEIKGVSLKETSDILIQLGLTLRITKTQEVLSGCVQALREYSINSPTQNEYNERYQIVKKGFGLNEEYMKIEVENYLIKRFSTEEIREALLLLNEYISDFPTERERVFLSHNIKWGLYSPFIYCTKQLKRIIPYPYLQGTGGVGKTLGHGYPILCMWYDDPNEAIVAGSKMKSRAQFGAMINQSTFPLVVNEGANLFEDQKDKESRDYLKSAIEETILRHTRGSEGKIYKTLNPFIVTSNGHMYDPTDAITRRLDAETFTMQEKKNENEEGAVFADKYGIGSSESRLLQLQAISHTFAQHMIDNPELLKQNWKTVTLDFITGLYDEYDVEMPEVLQEFAPEDNKGTEQLDIAKEYLKQGIQSIINKERKYITININDEETKRGNEESDPWIYTKVVLIDKRVPGLIYKDQGSDGEYVIITQGFITTLYNEGHLDTRHGIKDFATEYGFNYDQNKKWWDINKAVKGCWLEYTDFIDWLHSC